MSARYEADGLLERNRDPLTSDLAALLTAARSPFLAGLFRDEDDEGDGTGGTPGRAAAAFAMPSSSPRTPGSAARGGAGGAGAGSGRTVAWEFRRQVLFEWALSFILMILKVL